MHTKTYLTYFVGILFLLTSCSPNENTSLTPQNIAFAKSSMSPTTKGSTAMIYDLDQSTALLSIRAVELKENSGNYLEDLIRTFIQENRFLKDKNKLTFEISAERKCSFTGQLALNNPGDSIIFWDALDITIARNANFSDYAIDHQLVHNY